uniref:Uncharacterized protein n=1 Tax=Glossina pallidipes TaxID=7398 RepID=A0A1B0AHC9_GLOPL
MNEQTSMQKNYSYYERYAKVNTPNIRNKKTVDLTNHLRNVCFVNMKAKNDATTPQTMLHYDAPDQSCDRSAFIEIEGCERGQFDTKTKFIVYPLIRLSIRIQLIELEWRGLNTKGRHIINTVPTVNALKANLIDVKLAANTFMLSFVLFFNKISRLNSKMIRIESRIDEVNGSFEELVQPFRNVALSANPNRNHDWLSQPEERYFVLQPSLGLL